VCGSVEKLGVFLDTESNRAARSDKESFVNQPRSETAIIVIPTDEELVIVHEVLRAL